MKKANPQSPTKEGTRFDLNLPGNEIKYVRTKSYPSTSRNLVEQVATTVSSQQVISDKEYLSHIKRESTASSVNVGMGRKPSMKDRLKRQPSASGDKKTRWLLTRKTWRYMADAGRKLIPEGVQNKPENIEKIEEHFQKLCQNEKKFLIWKRKLSYPGASGSFRRKNKNKVGKRPFTVGSPPTGSSADECEDGERTRKGTDDLIIKMLEKYLNLNSDIEEKSESENGKQSSQSSSSSSSHASTIRQREINNNTNRNRSTPSTSGASSVAMSSNVAMTAASLEAADSLDPTKSNIQEHSIWDPVPGNESIHSSLLLDSLKQYRKKNYSPYIDTEAISGDLLRDKVLLRKILNDIKTQQKYSKTIPRTESTRSLNISYSSSMSSLTSTISSTFHNFVDFIDTKASSCRNTIRGFGGDNNHGQSNVSISGFASAAGSSGQRELRQYKSSDVGSKSSAADTLSSAFYTVPISRTFNISPSSSAMLSRPHQIYNQQKQIFASQQQQQMWQQQQQYPRSSRTVSTTLKTITKTTSTTTISTSSKQLPDSSSSNPTSPTSLPGILKNAPKKPVKTFKELEIQTDGIPLSTLNTLFDEYKKQVELERQEEEDAQQGEGGRGNRKLSIDNKDVSQSVSDTIKRYLMMARKKPKDNDAANKFKRVNYDRNLRNIKAKGEITKPGDDDGLMKGCQTDSDWLEVLFSNSEELHRCFTSPIFTPIVSSPTSTSPPPSIPSSPPSPAPGIIQSGTQFLSNLFYHSGSNQSNSPTPSNSSASTIIANSGAMQKSKSSSNVGHLMSKKIFRSRSKSQTRGHVAQLLVPASSDIKSQWTPQVSVQKYFFPSPCSLSRNLPSTE
jgi:hypothetical protein